MPDQDVLRRKGRALGFRGAELDEWVAFRLRGERRKAKLAKRPPEPPARAPRSWAALADRGAAGFVSHFSPCASEALVKKVAKHIARLSVADGELRATMKSGDVLHALPPAGKIPRETPEDLARMLRLHARIFLGADSGSDALVIHDGRKGAYHALGEARAGLPYSRTRRAPIEVGNEIVYVYLDGKLRKLDADGGLSSRPERDGAPATFLRLVADRL